MMVKRIFLIAATMALATAVADDKIVETLSLDEGWNGVYFESTPENADCNDFFADLPGVTQVGAYLPSAYETTEQYDSEGNLNEQKPVSYYVWQRGEDGNSTLQSIRGGMCYLIFTTNACEKTFRGVPGTPYLSWRECDGSDTNQMANLVAASVPASTASSVQIKTYFREGPAGASPTIWEIYGDGAVPELLAVTSKKPKLSAGKAYVMTARRTADWPGVVGVSGALGGIAFTSNGTDQAGIFLTNNGTTNHVFEISYGPGADGATPPAIKFELDAGWITLTNGVATQLSFEPGAQRSLNFSIDRSQSNVAGAGILSISDTGGTKMRVRVPVTVEPKVQTEADAAWPAGFWMGTLVFDKVNYLTNSTPVTAGGSVKATVLINWGTDGKVSLLQRASFGSDPTTGKLRIFKSLDTARSVLTGVEDKSIRRMTCVLMDPEQQVVTATNNVASIEGGASVGFNWTVGKYASTNPMRHSWHPDHDGVTYKSDGTIEAAPDGDNLTNYTYPTKPELFSIGNRVEFNLSSTAWTPDETMSGTVRWELTGLKSAKNGPVICTGTLTLVRVSSNAVIE